jgi:hypothetical protein
VNKWDVVLIALAVSLALAVFGWVVFIGRFVF